MMGVHKEYQRTGVAAAMMDVAFKSAINKGFRVADYSWILEDNTPVRSILELAGAKIYKTHRIYEMNLSAWIATLGLIDTEQLVIKTKKFVRNKGISVSNLVESLLKQAISENKTSFSQKWQGKLKSISPIDSPRYKKLSERYL